MDVSSDEEAALFHDYEQLEHLHKNRLIEMIEVQKGSSSLLSRKLLTRRRRTKIQDGP